MKKEVFVWISILTTLFVPTLFGEDIEKVKIRFMVFFFISIIALISTYRKSIKSNNKVTKNTDRIRY